MTVGVWLLASRSRSTGETQAPRSTAEPRPASAPATTETPRPPRPDPQIQTLVGRLSLARYKAAIKALTQFGDRRQGTTRNRQAVDWIEAQLASYGCSTGRIKYTYVTPPPQGRGRRGGPPATASPVIASGEMRFGSGGSRLRGITRPTGVN